jgi:hypothetical protein
MSIAAVVFYVILNVAFVITYDCKIGRKDEEFRVWR